MCGIVKSWRRKDFFLQEMILEQVWIIASIQSFVMSFIHLHSWFQIYWIIELYFLFLQVKYILIGEKLILPTLKYMSFKFIETLMLITNIYNGDFRTKVKKIWFLMKWTCLEIFNSSTDTNVSIFVSFLSKSNQKYNFNVLIMIKCIYIERRLYLLPYGNGLHWNQIVVLKTANNQKNNGPI